MKLSAWTQALATGTPAVTVTDDRLFIRLGNNSFFVDINDWVELSRAVVAAIDAANEEAA
jgi:hypothetical protein